MPDSVSSDGKHPTSDIVLKRSPPNGYSRYERAFDAWMMLRRLESQAEEIGGRELFLVISCAREVLERRWGPFRT